MALGLTIPALGLVLAGQFAFPAQALASHTVTTRWVTPNAVNNLDCNGWSPSYRSIRPGMKSLCVDPISVHNATTARFLDNGWYVGHDEPSVKFISSAPGSGNHMTYGMQLPRDPHRAPTASGSITTYGELSIAPWFGLPICDSLSYPQNPCTPNSDLNKGSISNPNDAGSAFMELQFYPPGFAPFVDSTSCSKTQWCAALTIDSLECSFNFGTCNNNCIEPVNFAFLQRNGVPAGPPSPQLADTKSFLGNAQTLKLNPEDALRVSITSPPQGLTAVVQDLTTHQTGYMVASAANGFMDTSISTCAGQPHTFRAEYSTAKKANQVPWAALEGGVLMEQEIGHFETCNSLTGKMGLATPGYTDPQVYQTCVGGSEGGPTTAGEGPCNLVSFTCTGATTQGTTGPAACSTNSAASGALCEFADGFCFPKGSRTVTIFGTKAKETSPVAACNQNFAQNGDLDFDGIPYTAAWPNGRPNHPTPIASVGRFG